MTHPSIHSVDALRTGESTADSQPPEGLRMIAYRAARDWARTHRHQQPDDRMVDAALAAVERAGFRLLPSGGEVKEQWAVRWHLVGGGVDEQDCYRNARETAEQRARRLAARPPMGVERGEALMRRIYTGPWSPVPSDNSEEPA